MRIDVLTLFPAMIAGYLQYSILQRAQARGLLQVELHDLRSYGVGPHRTTDEPPFGGGGGMVLKPEPIFAAAEAILGLPERHGDRPDRAAAADANPASAAEATPIILLTPQGRLFNQAVAAQLSREERILLIAGRYEGVDERVRLHLATDEISLGDFVLTGGELAALVVIDAMARLLPGALGAEGAAASDSHATGLLEGPHYTRPANFRGWTAPPVLRSGHAAEIARWRRQEALRRTWERRPELLSEPSLPEADRHFLAQLARERAAQRRSADG